MAHVTRLRVQNTFALITLKRWILDTRARLKPAPRGLHIKRLNEHLARDIGLSKNQLAQHQHIWPSEFVDKHER